MKLRHTAVLTAALSLSLLAGAGVAVAQDAETGPETQACADATTAAQTALTERDAAKVPSDVEQKAKAAQGEIDAAVAAYNALGTDLPAPTNAEGERLRDRLDDPDVVGNLELQGSIYDRSDAIVAVLDKTTAGAAPLKTLADAKAKLATEEQELAKAEEVRDTACAEPADQGNENPGNENPGNNDGNNDGNDDQGNDDNGSDNGGVDNGNVDNGDSGSGSTDNGLDPGPITSTNGESVYVPSGGVETGGGPA